VYRLNERLELQNQALSKRHTDIFDNGFEWGLKAASHCPTCNEPKSVAAITALKNEYDRGYRDGKKEK
jgi:hypothetical protein